jgi:cytochrome d ubiquinol oxidase subunit II
VAAHLPLLSAAFASFAIAIYVMLDGFDLGVGALLLIQADEQLRDEMVNSIVPMWDSNETWLVMAGVTLLAAFPVAYSIVLPAMYLPFIVMLLALGLRGVSFDFRFQQGNRRRLWDVAFSVGSMTAALMQGLILGGLIQGVTITGNHFGGSVFDILRVFPLITALAVLAGYVVLGGGWLHLKSEGKLHSFAEQVLRHGAPVFAALAIVACIAGALVQPGIQRAWAAHYKPLASIAILFLGTSVALTKSIGGRSDVRPFALGLILFALDLLGLVIVVFPNIVPFRLSLWDAASSTSTHVFLLIGAAIVTPVVLVYSAFAYHVFHGKTPAEGWEG